VILRSEFPLKIKEILAMAAKPSIDPAQFLHEQLASASPDLLRSLLSTFIEAVMSAEADVICGAPYGVASPDRVNSRNGYRHRDFDTRAGTIDVAIPKLRSGSYFPEWLLERRRRAEAALTSVVATCSSAYLLGVSTRRMEKLVESLGITRLSKSQGLGDGGGPGRAGGGVSDPAAGRRPLHVRGRGCPGAEGPRRRPGGQRPRPDRDRCNGDGHREIFGLHVTSSEDGAGWLSFFRDLTARGLTGVKLVTSDAHAGVVSAIGATLPGAGWQRCRTHYAANLMSTTPKSSWPW
jgi:putative transposase